MKNWGCETYKYIIGNDSDELSYIEQALMGGLGAKKIDLAERHLRGLLTYYKEFNEHQQAPAS